MDNYKLVETFSEFKEFKNIDREAMMRIIEDVFRGMLNKKFDTDTTDFIDIIVNVDKGDFEIYHNRTVVEDDELTDPVRQIKLSDAIKIEPDFEVGEEVNEELRIENFGRRDILALRQNLQTKVSEYEKENIFQKYKEKVGEIITAEVAHVWKREIVVIDDENIELILPKIEQIPTDKYSKGDTIRAIVKSVESVNGSPVVTLSRTSEIFLQRLLEAEVPEIYDGLITIKKIVREPGQRAKVAVESYDDRIDPVGACVGMKGTRIHGIVRELRNENIDVINWTTNPTLLITRALSPAKITNIVLSSDNTMANVYMENDQISLAIGKGGYNIKLAGKLTGYEIDVYRNSEANSSEEDVDLQEFSDEIDQWVIDSLVRMGCDTAKDVLSYTPEEVANRADLEIETVRDVFRILNAEFEQDAE
ncbi:MAG: transcription termination/antitermination protein NusA [Bacteroidales bacterium]|jgi:N utilization substance protein A|nr:transcription termination/antitermination protein NusA [Bacteroidales bacterium]